MGRSGHDCQIFEVPTPVIPRIQLITVMTYMYNGRLGPRVSSSRPLNSLQEFIISRFVVPEVLTVRMIIKDVALIIDTSGTFIWHYLKRMS